MCEVGNRRTSQESKFSKSISFPSCQDRIIETHTYAEHNGSRQPRGRSCLTCSDGWRANTAGPIHTAEYRSALNRKEILTPTTAWMKPEDAVLKSARHGSTPHM